MCCMVAFHTTRRCSIGEACPCMYTVTYDYHVVSDSSEHTFCSLCLYTFPALVSVHLYMPNRHISFALLFGANGPSAYVGTGCKCAQRNQCSRERRNLRWVEGGEVTGSEPICLGSTVYWCGHCGPTSGVVPSGAAEGPQISYHTKPPRLHRSTLMWRREPSSQPLLVT